MRAAIVVLALAGLGGCDKLKAAMGKGDDAGATGSTGGGVLSFLGGDFEGEITMLVTSKKSAKQPTTMVIGIKKPKYRLDAAQGLPSDSPMLSAQGASFILDPPQKKGYMLVPSRKQAIVLDFEKMKSTPGAPGFGGASGKPGAGEPPPKIEKAGKDVVAGYECEIWRITPAKGNKAEICAAEGIKWFDVTDLGWSSPELTVAAAATGANHFPLRIIAFDAKGAEETRLEATKVDKKKLADTQFVVPPDYKVMDLTALMGGMPVLGPNGMPAGMPTNIPKPPR